MKRFDEKIIFYRIESMIEECIARAEQNNYLAEKILKTLQNKPLNRRGKQ